MSWIQVAFAGRGRERGDEDGAPDTTTAILAAHKRKKMDDWTTDERPKDTESHDDLTGAPFILRYKRSDAAKTAPRGAALIFPQAVKPHLKLSREGQGKAQEQRH